MKIAPEYSAADGARARRVARGRRRRRACSSDAQRAEFERQQPRRCRTTLREQYSAAPRAAAAAVRRGAREPAADRLGAPRRCRRPSFLGRRVLDDVPLARARAVHRLDVLLHRLGAEGPLPGDPRASAVRRGGARALRQRAGAARAHRRREAADGARRLRLLARRAATATTSCVYATTSARGELTRFHMLRQQEPIADGKPNRSLADFVAAARARRAGLHRRVRRDRRHRRRRARAAVRARARRLQRDHGQGAGRSAGRGVRRVPARAGARATGATARRAVARGPHRREVPRHPARRSAIRRARITARSSSCSSCSTRRRSASR